MTLSIALGFSRTVLNEKHHSPRFSGIYQVTVIQVEDPLSHFQGGATLDLREVTPVGPGMSFIFILQLSERSQILNLFL